MKKEKEKNCIDCAFFHRSKMVATDSGEYGGRYCNQCASIVFPAYVACDSFDFMWGDKENENYGA